MTKIQPAQRNILVEPEESKTTGGILVPEEVNQTKGYYKGRVIEVGHGVRTPEGKIVPLVVEKGDTIFFYKYAPIRVDGKEYMVTLEEQVIAIIKNDKK